MVKRDPDDLITALSKNLKSNTSPVLRFTFKRGGLWQPRFAKAHSRKAKVVVREELKSEASNAPAHHEWPLLIRFRSNEKEDVTRLNCQARLGKGGSFIESLLGVFRVNFFNKKGLGEKKETLAPTKADPNSKTSIRRKQRKDRNRERRNIRTTIKRKARVVKQSKSNN